MVNSANYGAIVPRFKHKRLRLLVAFTALTFGFGAAHVQSNQVHRPFAGGTSGSDLSSEVGIRPVGSKSQEGDHPSCAPSVIVAPFGSSQSPSGAKPGGAGSKGRSADSVLIPLVGSVGLCSDVGFTAKDFNNCITQVEKSGCKKIALHIKSGGGRVDTKEAIQHTVLGLRAKGYRVVAIIEDAGSAAALIALACDEWYALPGARLGAAATVLSDGEHTISFEKALEQDPTLKAKYQSFASAKDAEACRATGRPPELAAAMKEKKATLFYTPDIGFTSLRQNGSSIELDSDETILTLTTTQLVDYKLAKPAATVEEAQNEIGVFDEAVSKKMATTIQKMSKEVASLMTACDKLAAEYKRHSLPGSRQSEARRERMRDEAEQKFGKKLEDLVQLLNTP